MWSRRATCLSWPARWSSPTVTCRRTAPAARSTWGNQYSGPSVIQTRVADVLTAGWEPYFNVTEQELLQGAHILEVAIGQFQVVTWRQFGSVDPDNEVVWLECATAEGFITLNWVRWCSPGAIVALRSARHRRSRRPRRDVSRWR